MLSVFTSFRFFANCWFPPSSPRSGADSTKIASSPRSPYALSVGSARSSLWPGTSRAIVMGTPDPRILGCRLNCMPMDHHGLMGAHGPAEDADESQGQRVQYMWVRPMPTRHPCQHAPSLSWPELIVLRAASEGAGVSHGELVRQLAQQAYRGATSRGGRHSRPTTASSRASERQWSTAGQRVWPLGPTPTNGVPTWQHPQIHASCGPRRAARAKRGCRAPQRT